MTDPQTQKQDPIYTASTSIMSFIATWAGLLAAVFGMVTIFFVASIQPDGSVDLKETLYNHAFWVLTAVTVTIAVTVGLINYRSTKQKERESDDFTATRVAYKQAKDKVADHFDTLPDFCADKTTQLRLLVIRDRVESAGIKWSQYDPYSGKNCLCLREDVVLETWQKKLLKKANAVKVKPLRAKDILQEESVKRNGYKTFLGPDERSLERKFIGTNLAVRIVSIALTNFVFGLGVVLTNWVTGLANALGVLLALVGAIVTGVEHVRGPLRQRYITKTDLLTEFNIVKYKYREPVPVVIDTSVKA